jgi:hypothetical protein
MPAMSKRTPPWARAEIMPLGHHSRAWLQIGGEWVEVSEFCSSISLIATPRDTSKLVLEIPVAGSGAPPKPTKTLWDYIVEWLRR